MRKPDNQIKEHFLIYQGVNLYLSKKGTIFDAKSFLSDRGHIDFITLNPEDNTLVFKILLVNKEKDFRKRSNWYRSLMNRRVLYTMKWYMQKKKYNSEYRLDIIEAFINKGKIFIKEYEGINIDLLQDNEYIK